MSMISATSNWLQGLAKEFGLTPEDLYHIDLCLSELVTNVVSYAEAQFTGMSMELRAEIESQRITFTLIDSAQPFDPLSVPPPPIAKNIEDMQVGGRGIHLVREFCDAIRYERSCDKNHIELEFNLASPTTTAQREILIPRNVDRRNSETPPDFPFKKADGTVIKQDRRSMPDRRAKGFLSWAQIFHNVPYSALEDLVDRFPIQSIAATITLLSPGDLNDEVLIVLDGRLRVCLDQPDTSDFIEIGPGGCVGEMSVIDNSPASAYVVAEPGVSLLVVDAVSFLNAVMKIPNVSRNLISALSERMRRSNEQTIKRLHKELTLKHIQRELQFARSIQASLLPKEPLFPDDSRLDCVGRMCAAREVGGDFYDIFFLDSKRIFFVIADVCGKGLPAALFMVRAIASLRAQSESNDQSTALAEQITTHLNEQLCAYNDDKQFLTAFSGILNLETGLMHYVNAGHNAPLLSLGDGPFNYLEEPINPIVGLIEGIEFRAGEISLPPQSALLLYTDGVTEAENPEGNMLGDKHLLACLNAAPRNDATQLVDNVFANVREFATDAPQSDDVTVLAICLADAGRK